MAADPLSVTGVAIGVVSLGFQVFDSSVRCFKFIRDASRKDKTCRDQRLALIMQFNKFMEWGKQVGLVEQEKKEDIAKILGASQYEMVAVVSEISALLQAFADCNEEYRTFTAEEDPASAAEAEKHDIVREVNQLVIVHEKSRKERAHTKGTNHIRSAGSKIVDFVKHPSRIVWNAVDKDAFDELLKRFTELTEHLIGMLDDYKQNEIYSNVKNTYLGTVQLTDNVEDLNRLVTAALLFIARKAEDSQRGVLTNETMLGELARLKTFNQPANTKDKDVGVEALRMTLDRVSYTKEQAKEKWTLASFRPDADNPASLKQVWVEWKAYETEYDSSGTKTIHAGTLRRTAELSSLLSHKKPSAFATPQCLGYFDENEGTTRPGGRGRFGWIFEIPASAPAKSNPWPLSKLMSTLDCPSLTERVALGTRVARCVLYLHVVNWLHKGLRSDNIIYICDGTNVVWSEAILSGFEYARPDNSSTTDNPEFNAERDVYRWPDIQGSHDTEKRSRKTYDIYALGLLLMEIAYWKHVGKILKFSDEIKNITKDQSKDIRKTLLDPKLDYLNEVERRMGTKYAAVTHRCLLGREGFEIPDGPSENDPVVGLKLQDSYTQNVVDQLGSINI